MADDGFNYSDVEDNIDEDDELEQSSSSLHNHNPNQQHPHQETILDRMMQSYDWAAVLGRIKSHPHECRHVGVHSRTPLHIACDHDAPAVVIQALLKAYPEASVLTGTANMNPLHITCSSQHASVHVVRMLLEFGRFEQFSMRDLDGDTPLHAACRCGASQELVELLLRAYPSAVTVRDYEGLTPLLRLWVRYFVILGEDAIESVTCAADLQGELLDAWKKTERLLQCAHLGSLNTGSSTSTTAAGTGTSLSSTVPRSFLALHAASAVDCPRSIVKIAARVYPQQLLHTRDEEGRTPLMVACQAPVYAVRDLSDEGYTLEDIIHGDVAVAVATNESTNSASSANSAAEDETTFLSSSSGQPSVIEILLQAAAHSIDDGSTSSTSTCHHRGASLTDPSGRLPLHMALETGKVWNQGVGALIEAYPDSVRVADRSSRLYPFQLAGAKNNLDCAFELLRRNPMLLKREQHDSVMEDNSGSTGTTGATVGTSAAAATVVAAASTSGGQDLDTKL